MYKTCKLCLEHKPLDAFHKHHKGLLGRFNKCKACRSGEYLRQPLYTQCEGAKKCPRCCEEKSPSDFFVNRSSKSGSSALCKSCYKLYKKEPIENKEKYIEAVLEKHEHLVTKRDLLDLLEKQDARCAITNHPFTYLINRDGSIDHIWNMRILDKNTLVCDFIYSASKIYSMDFEQLKLIYREMI